MFVLLCMGGVLLPEPGRPIPHAAENGPAGTTHLWMSPTEGPTRPQQQQIDLLLNRMAPSGNCWKGRNRRAAVSATAARPRLCGPYDGLDYAMLARLPPLA